MCMTILHPILELSANYHHRPRKINSVLQPLGYKWASGRIVEDTAVTDGFTKGNVQGEDGSVAKTPSKTTAKKAKTTASKKRKVISEEEEIEEEAEAKDEDAEED